MARWLLAIVLVAAYFPLGCFGAAPQQEFERLVNANCVSCHGEKKSEGELRLDSADNWSNLELLDSVISRIADGEMPPEDSPRDMSADDKSQLLSLLKSRLRELETQQQLGGYRKLTATEYSDTLNDVFGKPLSRLRDLPFDSDHDFKKIGQQQVVTSYAVQKYYDVARKYLDRLIVHEPIVVRETTYTAASGKDLLGRQYTTTHGALGGGGNEPIFEIRNPVQTIAQEGEFELTFHYHCFFVPPKERIDLNKEYEPADALQPPIIKYFSRAGGEVLNPVMEYKDDKQSLCNMEQPIRIRLTKGMKFLPFRGPGKSFKQSPEKDPRQLKLETSDLPPDEKKKALTELRRLIRKEAEQKKSIFMLITGATFRGPLNKSEPESHAVVFGDVKRTDGFEKIPPILRRFAHNLFRRPVSHATLAAYEKIARHEWEDHGNVYLAVKVALNAMLCSPHFVFKFEGDSDSLDDYAIASRLSYFLWNSAPDDELLSLAAAGKLTDPAIRIEQAARLLNKRSKSKRFTANFTRQWLGLHKFADYTPNEAYIQTGAFSNLKPHFDHEPVAFFNEVLHTNQSALCFIDSDFVVWNDPLAGYYGSNGLKVNRTKQEDPTNFRRLTLNANPDSVRGGLVSMASIMSLTTDGENTQPILRGVWVARRLLGLRIEAPASVPAIEVNLENVSKPREILAKHKTDRSCYACHVKFDYLGLALENYDVIGRWKTDYVHPVLNEKNRFQLVKRDPIDANAETPAGEAMPGVAGLKQHLLHRQDEVMKNLLEKLFAYSIGREVRYTDRNETDALFTRMKANDFRLQDAVLDLVASPVFTKR